GARDQRGDTSNPPPQSDAKDGGRLAGPVGSFRPEARHPASHGRCMNGPMRDVVAVVDDDARILESLEDLLESAGYEVQAFSSGSALLASGVAKIACLITDVGMPVMDGFELRDRVKRERPELPVFLISGRRDLVGDGPLDGRAHHDVFRKPFDAKVLLAEI